MKTRKGEPPESQRDNRERWAYTKEKILLVAGLVLIGMEAISVPLGIQWSHDFVVAGLALCGVAITQWGDKQR